MRGSTQERLRTPEGTYTIILKKTGRQYVSLCLELSVVGCGRTRENALQSVRDAIDSYLESVEGTNLPRSRPVPIDLLHDFLWGEESVGAAVPKVRAEVQVLAYA